MCAAFAAQADFALQLEERHILADRICHMDTQRCANLSSSIYDPPGINRYLPDLPGVLPEIPGDAEPPGTLASLVLNSQV